jgi:hypothetical protein
MSIYFIFPVWKKYTCVSMLATMGVSFLLSFQRLLCVTKFNQMNKADATEGYVPVPDTCDLFNVIFKKFSNFC